jgi:hypothetical protein
MDASTKAGRHEDHPGGRKLGLDQRARRFSAALRSFAIVTEAEELLRDKLASFVDDILERMVRRGELEPGLLPLIAGATAAIAMLDRRGTSAPS